MQLPNINPWWESSEVSEGLPIRYKLQVIVMLISCSALLLACTAFGIFEIIHFQNSLTNELSVLAKITADRSANALSARDPEPANRMLASLTAKRSIISAHILNPDKSIFAEYHRKGTTKSQLHLNKRVFEKNPRFEADKLFVSQPVMTDSRLLGIVYICSDLEDMHDLIRRYLLFLIFIFLFSSLAAFTMVSKLRHIILKPILDLARAVKSFPDNIEHGVHIPKQSEDDLGFLVDAFNEMVEQIRQRDAELTQSKNKAEETAMIAERLAEDTMAANLDMEDEIIERKRMETRLRESEEKYRNLFDFAPDGIVITDLDGKLLSFNDAAMKIFKYEDRNIFPKLSALDFYHNPERDRPALLDIYKKIGHTENYDIIFKDKTGKPFPASVSGRLIHYEGRSCIQSIIRDITRIKKMEAELRDYAENLEQKVNEKTRELKSANKELSTTIKTLEETREQLSLKAHQAGMAEIAVSVLHNIGNAINSVNVRMYHHQEKLDRLEIISLEKIHGMLQSEEVVFQGTLAERKGMLLKYFSSIINTLKETQEHMLGDCDFIKKGLDHLMEIIFLQQKYAGVKGAETFEDVNEILKDSADMMMDSIQKRRISLEFDLTPVAKMYINRNKMIQIFINIIKNAYEAIDMAPPENEKKIMVATSVEKENKKEYVQTVITDTGIGVSREDLTRVFRFNYSTKERGTGFGLHNSGNYINAQSGTIRLHSEGIGKGTQVVIRLPASND
ncbi:MAG: PAS domain S-box protein [Desulfobacterales bacterium]|nr:PAS domain S-box protein [Desulfobacterales bacterium]